MLACATSAPFNTPVSQMISQKVFITACSRYYLRNKLEPGNPLHGEWHQAHYPTPKCLGGESTVWLLKHHHALHGIIQSEEVGHCCVFTWERSLLPKRYQLLYDKWRSWLGSRAGYASAAAQNPEQMKLNRSRAGKARAARMSEEEKRLLSQQATTWRKANPDKVALNAAYARSHVRRESFMKAVRVTNSNGESIVYQSVTEACEGLNVSRSTLSRHMNHERRVKALAGLAIEFV